MENIFANMDFVEKAPETITEEKTAPATGEILVNRDEYKKAVEKAIENAAKDPKLEGMASLMYCMSGASFALEVETILFGEMEG